MKWQAALAGLLTLSGCGRSDTVLSENDIANRAAAIGASANATVDAQIADIEQAAAANAPAVSGNSSSDTSASNMSEPSAK